MLIGRYTKGSELASIVGVGVETGPEGPLKEGKSFLGVVVSFLLGEGHPKSLSIWKVTMIREQRSKAKGECNYSRSIYDKK